MGNASEVRAVRVGALVVVAALLMPTLLVAPAVVADVAPLSENRFGRPVSLADDRAEAVFASLLPFTGFCVADQDGDGLVDPGEGVYAVAGPCDVVHAHALRVSAPGPVGTQARVSDADFGATVVQLPSVTVAFHDADGGAGFGLGDDAYIDTDGGLLVSGGDVRLTAVAGFAPGGHVLADDVDVGRSLVAPAALAPSLWRFVDANGDGAYGEGDRAYIGREPAHYPLVGDVRVHNVGTYPFGSRVLATEVDAVSRLLPGPFQEACYRDEDGSGTPGGSEAVFTLVGPCGEVAVGSLRLSGPDAGRQVLVGDPLVGVPVLALPSRSIGYYDASGDERFTLGDVPYLDADGSSSVTTGDLRLTFGLGLPGTLVATADADLGLSLASQSSLNLTSWTFLDADGQGAWSPEDDAYLDANLDGVADAGDVRMSVRVGFAFGSEVRTGHADAFQRLAPLPFTAICFRDLDGSGLYTPEEPLVASTGCGTVRSLDLRLTHTALHVPGTQVRVGDPDLGRPSLPASTARVGVVDLDGDGTFSLGDGVVLDLDEDLRVSLGDLRLTSGARFSGTIVHPSDSDAGTALLPSPDVALTSWAFLDAHGDGRWTDGDTAFLDGDGTGSVTAGDLELGPGVRQSVPTPPPPSALEEHLRQLIQQNVALALQLNASLTLNQHLQQQLSDLHSQLLHLHAQAGLLQAENHHLLVRLSQLLAENEQLRAELQNQTPNRAPRAVFDVPFQVECVQGQGVVPLDGLGSYDPEGLALGYFWQAYGGSVAHTGDPFTTATLPLGEHAVTLAVADGALFDVALETARVVDTVPPTVGFGAVRGLPGLHGWHRSPVEVDLHAGDACGLASVRYRVEARGGSEEHHGDHLVLWRDGVHRLHAFASDLGGNGASTAEALMLRLDALPPAMQLRLEGEEGAAGWFRSPVTVVADLTDATSGPWGVEVAHGGNASFVPAPAGPVALATLDAGRHRLVARGMDAAGNHGPPQEVLVQVDLQAPVTRASVTGTAGDGGWWRSAVAVDLAALDDLSGVHAVYASVDGGAFAPAGQVVVGGDGPHEVAYYAVDRAGNAESPRRLALRIDATAPDVALRTPEENTLYLRDTPFPLPVEATVLVGPHNVTAEGGDAQAGLARFELWVDGTLRATREADGPVAVLPWLADEALREHLLEVRAVDRAGNHATVGREVVTVPSSQRALLSTAACESLVAERLCAAIPSEPVGLEEACSAVLSPRSCASLAVICRDVAAEGVCGLAPQEAAVASPRLAVAAQAARGSR